jgi:hypothetical protein
MAENRVLGVEGVCFWLKQFVSDCTNHCTHCTRLYGEDNCVNAFRLGWLTFRLLG